MQDNYQTDREFGEVLQSEFEDDFNKQLQDQLGLDEKEAQEYQERMKADALAKTNKILKKHGREIQRLRKHAEGAVLENNFPAYKYAMEKLRSIYKQPFNDELIAASWQTTRAQVWKIINDNQG